MDSTSGEQRSNGDEGAAANLQSKRVREVFKYLPDWAPKTEGSPTRAAVLSPDVTLNAFAQLVALRLDVDRSLISFLDGEEQYVLAEATKNSSLQQGRPTRTDDALLTGMRTIASGQGLCYEALSLVPADGILVIEDIHKDEHFCFRPFTQSAPEIQFYAACPIIINNEKVGILCIINAETRPSFTPDEINFLSDVASSIARHLESTRMKRTHTRSADIVAALDAVMKPSQGYASLRASSRDLQVKNSDASEAQQPHEEKDKDAKLQQFNTKLDTANLNIKSSVEFLEYAGSLLVNGFNADGVVFYDAGSRIYTNGMSRRSVSHGVSSISSPTSPQASTFSKKFEQPQPRDSLPCKILALSNGRDQPDWPTAVGDLQEQSLRDLLELYPRGKILHVGDIEISPGNQSSEEQSDDPSHPGYSRVAQCLRTAIPDAQSVVFFPLWDHCRERWYAGGFLWSSNARRLMFTDGDLNFLRAFALVLTGELASRDQERSHLQKDTFISMISHELRTPLHGILSNVDLMKDIGLTTFQATLLDTISACGHSLMDIINNLIDRSSMASVDENFKKAHQISKKHRRAPLRRLTSYDKLEEVDLVIVTEEVISALAVEMHLRVEARQGYEAALKSSNSSDAQDLLPSHAVVVYDIFPQHNWTMRIRKGAFRRLLANLTSNAIKFTREGTIQISLHRQDPSKDSFDCTVTLEIEDTGEGISSDFLEHHLFQQFQQENSHTIGSGLGLYIVKSMSDELGGHIDIRSSKGDGTCVSISFPCELVDKSGEETSAIGADYADPILQQVKTAANRLTACFIDSKHDERPADIKSGLQHSKDSLTRVCQNWFGIQTEAPSKLKAGRGIVNFVDEALLDSRCFSDILADMSKDLEWIENGKKHISPVVFVGTVNFTAALQRQPKFEARQHMFSITNPCGPHQLARVLKSCLSLASPDSETIEGLQIESSMEGLTLSQPSEDLPTNKERDSAVFRAQPHILTASSAALPATKSIDLNKEQVPTASDTKWEKKPYMLLVEDNAINMKVLERLCNRLSLSYALAFNGLEAVKLFEADPAKFDIIWMDIMMPVMDGIAATQQIRNIEKGIGRVEDKNRARVVALTGLSGEDIETDAENVGFDAFWTKPVKLDLLKKEVDKWARIKEEQEH